MNHPQDEFRPIFIGGTGRCGTTILANILHSHSNIFGLRQESSGSMEGRFITTSGGLLSTIFSPDWPAAFETFKTHMLGKWYREEITRNNGAQTEIGLCRYIPDIEVLEKLLSELENGLKNSANPRSHVAPAKTFVEAIFKLAVQDADCDRIVEKTPANILYIQELLSMFPAAKFIHIHRDGRDVAASITEKKFWPIWENTKDETYRTTTDFSVGNAAIYWRNYFSYGRAQGSQASPDQYLEVALETLVARPEEKLEEICAFLGEDLENKMLRVKLDRANVQRWHSTFTEEDKESFKKEAGDLLVALAYEENDGW